MNESSRQASLPAALPGGYGAPQPVGPGPGHLLGQEPWIPPPYMISGSSSSEFDSMRAGLFTSGFHEFNKHYPPYSYNYPTKGDARNGMDADGGPPPEGLTARLLDKGSNAAQQPPSHENVPTPPMPSREGTPAGNVGYRPWEQPPDGAPLDSAQIQRSPSAQQDKQGSGTVTPGSRDSRSGTPFRSQEYLSQNQLSDHGNSMDRTNTPNRPPSHLSSGPSPESHQDSQESLEGDVNEKLQRLTPQNQSSMCPPPPGPLHMASNHPSQRGTIQFSGGNAGNNISQFPPGHLNVYLQGQSFPTSPGSQRFFPDPKRMKIEADSSTADFRGPLENSFQVPSVSSTTSRQQALPLPPMHHPPIEQWDSGGLPQTPGLPTHPDLEKVPKKKRKRCGECPGCMKKDNCGECGPCKSVRSHQICKMRKCDQLKTKKEREMDLVKNVSRRHSPPLADRMAAGYNPPEYTPPKQVHPPPPNPRAMYDPQYNFPPQQVLSFNGHNHQSDPDELDEFGAAKHKIMNSRLKTLIQNRQNQKELQGLSQVDSYAANQMYTHSSLPPNSMQIPMHDHAFSDAPQPPPSMQMHEDAKNRSPTGDLNMIWSDVASSPLQKGKEDLHNSSSHFDKNNQINNDKAYSRGDSNANDQQLGFLGGLENQRDSNGINYGSFYEQQDSTKESSNLDQNHHQGENRNVMFTQSALPPPKYSSRSDGIKSDFFQMASNQTPLPPASSPYAIPNNNAALNSSPMFSPQSQSPLNQDQMPYNNTPNPSVDSAETRPSESNPSGTPNNNGTNNNDNNTSSSRNETSNSSSGAENGNEQSSESESFLLNTTTSMNTFTSIINSYNNLAPIPSSSFLSTLPSVSSLFGSGHPVIASPNGPELKHSLYNTSLTGGVPIIDSGRIEDSSSNSADFFGLPPSLSSSKHSSSMLTPLLSSDLSSTSFVLPLATMNWWEHYDRLKPKHEVPLEIPAASSESDAFSNNGHSEFHCPPPNSSAAPSH